jgi:two-component system, chemotaxis family, response regulator Rcp1
MLNESGTIRKEFVPRRAPHCPDILLVEDCPADAELVETILREVQPNCELYVVSNGVEALDFLHRRNRFAGAARPQLIVLDWQLPRANGDRTLTDIKSDPDLHRIPVVILSACESDAEILQGYDLHASCWVVKGTDLDESHRRIRALIEFWSRTAQLPRPDHGLPRTA